MGVKSSFLNSPDQISAAVLEGSRLALARLLTQVENNTPTGQAALSALFLYTGRAHLIGVTGAPGTGKSSLVNQLARFYRQTELGQSTAKRVAVVAVDPTSPFTGGAILGDRVRMRDLSGDPGVFIRSMASRGSLGGLAAATSGFILALDAAGFDIILIETVGAGQAEVDIARLAHTTVVVEAPGLGDDIQAIKAGILEIADVLVINKADRPGAESTERALRSMLQLSQPALRSLHHHGRIEANSAQEPQEMMHAAQVIQAAQALQAAWIPPLVPTVATEGAGISELAEAIEKHRQHLAQTGGWQNRERTRLQAELETKIRETLVERWREGLPDSIYQSTLDALLQRKISPQEAVARLVNGD
jgi:LAO/AO transport system kinase